MNSLSHLSPRARLVAFISVGLLLIAAIGAVWFFVIPAWQQGEDPGIVATRHIQNSEYDEAIAVLTEALEKDPENVSLLVALVQAYSLKGNATGTEREMYALAQPYAVRAIEHAPNNPELLLTIGYMAEIGGRYQEASEYYAKATVLDLQNAQAFFRLAHVLEFLGEERGYIDELYARAYALDPDNPQVLLAMGARTLASIDAEEDLDAAYAFFATAADKAEEKAVRAEGWASAARVRLMQGYFEEAITFASLAVNEDRSYVPGLVVYAEAIAHDGRLEEALGYLTEAIEKNPRHSKAHYTAGVLLRARSDYEQAVEQMNIALAKISDDNTLLGESSKEREYARVLYDIAKTHDMAGDIEASFSALEDAVAIDATMAQHAFVDAQEYGFFVELSSQQRFTALGG